MKKEKCCPKPSCPHLQGPPFAVFKCANCGADCKKCNSRID